MVGLFLEDHYTLMDPQGIAERMEDNQRAEAELFEVEVNYLAHLFVLNRPQFLDAIQNGPEVSKTELAALALQLPPDGDVRQVPRAVLENLYVGGCEVAWEWQEQSPDCDDIEGDNEGILLPLRRALRRFLIEA